MNYAPLMVGPLSPVPLRVPLSSLALGGRHAQFPSELAIAPNTHLGNIALRVRNSRSVTTLVTLSGGKNHTRKTSLEPCIRTIHQWHAQGFMPLSVNVDGEPSRTFPSDPNRTYIPRLRPCLMPPLVRIRAGISYDSVP